eukprot:365209-Chlamydomonas_euryale.AAC.4
MLPALYARARISGAAAASASTPGSSSVSADSFDAVGLGFDLKRVDSYAEVSRPARAPRSVAEDGRADN